MGEATLGGRVYEGSMQSGLGQGVPAQGLGIGMTAGSV